MKNVKRHFVTPTVSTASISQLAVPATVAAAALEPRDQPAERRNPMKQTFQKVNLSVKVAQRARLNTSNHFWKLHYLDAEELKNHVSPPWRIKTSCDSF